MGKDLVMQFGGGIHAHPDGTFRGAIAVRQALEAYMRKIPLKQYAKDHIELKHALKHWEK
jgi:ribulose-bisphosphate carboxylase large chain